MENSNFSLRTTGGDFILTLYERRVDPAELPWFLGLMEHLAGRGITCPLPVRARTARRCARSAAATAAITTFLPGVWPRRVQPAHCGPLGAALAGLHWPAPTTRRRAPMRSGRRLAPAAGALPAPMPTEVRPAWRPNWRRRWRRSSPPGRPICRAGTSTPTCSPTTFSSWTAALSGLIDFYFAATDILAYDLAVCLNAWCFEPDFAST